MSRVRAKSRSHRLVDLATRVFRPHVVTPVLGVVISAHAHALPTREVRLSTPIIGRFLHLDDVRDSALLLLDPDAWPAWGRRNGEGHCCGFSSRLHEGLRLLLAIEKGCRLF